uniref:Uncharacterized protein n=1 Tax=Oryza meridionalis TaxID=40149 RepID=A0A0E0C9Z4_9ORYZ
MVAVAVAMACGGGADGVSMRRGGDAGARRRSCRLLPLGGSGSAGVWWGGSAGARWRSGAGYGPAEGGAAPMVAAARRKGGRGGTGAWREEKRPGHPLECDGPGHMTRN